MASVEILWKHDFEAALNEARDRKQHMLLYFGAAPM